MIKIALIGIDNRPICYDIIQDILSIDNDIKLFMPDIDIFGDLEKKADIDKLFEFVKNLDNVDYFIISLDTIAYGGLIPSRRCEDDFLTIKRKIEKFKKEIDKKNASILAFSSIMRISNNNINEEEKVYWNNWGKKIFNWSYNLHKSKVENSAPPICDIDKTILDDYLKTRKRNFEINKLYLNWAKEGFFDTLIFSKDDCAEFGLNVQEAQELQEIIKKGKINNVKIKTGADEIPLALISRAINYNNSLKIKPVFLESKSKNLISKYEDISIEDCVYTQIELAKCIIDKKTADINLIVNNFKDIQGDLVLGDRINCLDKNIDFLSKPFFIADVNNANGADSGLIEQLFKQKTDNFFGYCAYNTSANTIGSAILTASIKYGAIRKRTYNDIAFKKIQFIRLLDDWVYQAIIRKYVRENAPDFSLALKEKEGELNLYAKKISDFLNFYPKNITYSLPWNRSFEIRIEI